MTCKDEKAVAATSCLKSVSIADSVVADSLIGYFPPVQVNDVWRLHDTVMS